MDTLTYKLESFAKSHLAKNKKIQSFFQQYIISSVAHHEQQALTLPFIDKLSHQMGIPSLVLVSIMGIASLLYAKRKFNASTAFLLNLFGVMYPLVVSFRALESSDSKKMKKCLSYCKLYT